jgi:hypothetical protein
VAHVRRWRAEQAVGPVAQRARRAADGQAVHSARRRHAVREARLELLGRWLLELHLWILLVQLLVQWGRRLLLVLLLRLLVLLLYRLVLLLWLLIQLLLRLLLPHGMTGVQLRWRRGRPIGTVNASHLVVGQRTV